MESPCRRYVIVVMGVAGSGKSTLGQALAGRLGVAFEEGDALHSPANVAKMRSGVPLTDADRAPWLASVAAWIAARAGRGGVISCSALKRAYRDRLRAGGDSLLRFVFLDVDPATLRLRLDCRRGHFMPASLLESQLTTLEPPTTEADALTVDGGADIDASVGRILGWLAEPIDEQVAGKTTGYGSM